MKPSQEMLDAWRAQVEKELAGAPFERLVHTTPEGIAVQPLYTEARAHALLPAPGPLQVCMRAEGGDEVMEEVEGGADAVWIYVEDDAAITAALSHGLDVMVEPGWFPATRALAWVTSHMLTPGAAVRRLTIAVDPVYEAGDGDGAVEAALADLGNAARIAAERSPNLRLARVSSLPFHDAGADAADEIALVLASGVTTLRGLLAAGLSPAAAARTFTVQVAVGRDTFGELCKLRALRLCWHKLIAAAGAPEAPPPLLHAVCSSRTMTQRDPWVNMLRVTTQVFGAALGGADLVTPVPYDAEIQYPSPLGRRVARNTALVLREESHLGRVVDPAGGSYYLETRTDQLAREAWSRFQAVERDGGLLAVLRSGSLRDRLDAAWQKRAAAIARRKEPVLGVSEFANLDEKLPAPVAEPMPPLPPAPQLPPGFLRPHRDAEAFEALRDRADRAAAPPVALVTLGPPSEHRGRLGYATTFFAAGGLRGHATRFPFPPSEASGLPSEARSDESRDQGPPDIACLCGSDERYAAEAAAAAAALKSAGCRRIVLAGKPGALEADLRAAGVDTFIFVGCDVAGTLAELLP